MSVLDALPARLPLRRRLISPDLPLNESNLRWLAGDGVKSIFERPKVVSGRGERGAVSQEPGQARSQAWRENR